MEIENIDINKLKKYKDNPRVNDNAVEPVMRSIKTFGFNNPILVDNELRICVGHTRLEAAKRLELKTVPIIKLKLSKAQFKAFNIADNKTASFATWDDDKLAKIIEDLQTEDVGLLDSIGFDDAEIERLLQSLDGEEGLTDDDEVPEDVEAVAKLGELWQLGEHRLMCGDATNKENVEALMGEHKADMVFTDPPYGMDGYADNIAKLYIRVPPAKEKYMWGNYKVLMLLKSWGFKPPRDVIIWKKQNFGMGKGYRGQYEMCFYWGEFNRSDSDVWDINKDDVNSYKHPTQKPVALAVRALKNSSKKENIVLDLFGGSGSTLIACEKLKRKCFMMELDPKYCDVIIKRWENYTGKKASLLNKKMEKEIENG